MGEILGVATGLKQRQMAVYVGPLISEGIIDAIADTGLCGEVNNALDGIGRDKVAHGPFIGDIDLSKGKTGKRA